jgi:hypothetical protein
LGRVYVLDWPKFQAHNLKVVGSNPFNIAPIVTIFMNQCVAISDVNVFVNLVFLLVNCVFYPQKKRTYL